MRCILAVLWLVSACGNTGASFAGRQAAREMREAGDEVKFLRRKHAKDQSPCKKHADCKIPGSQFCDADKKCDECRACENQFDSVDSKCPPCAKGHRKKGEVTHNQFVKRSAPACKAHAECTKTHFCDESKKCDECKACENAQDSVDGKCPSCKR